MSKKIEGNMIQTSRSIFKKQKSQVRASFDLGSQNSIAVGQTTDRRAVIHQVNFEFDFNPNGPAKQRQSRQIHSKQGTKRVGGKVIMPNKRQRRGDKKENNYQKSSQQRFSKDLQNQSIISQNSSQIVLLQIKSCFIEKQTQSQQKISCKKVPKHNRYISNIDSTASNNNKTEQKASTCVPTNHQSKAAQQIFQAINRKMAEQKELYNVKRTNKNCFFLNLKKKLQKQINRIEKQSERNQCKFLIEGCQIEKHRRILHLKSSLTDRVRPKTALQSNRTNISSVQKQKRPMSCQSRSPIHSRELKFLQQQSKKLLGLSQQKNKQRNTVKQKQCQNKYINNNFITFDQSNSLKNYKSQARESNQNLSKNKLIRKNQNQKLNQILAECNTLEGLTDLNKKMKTFQYYCQKMDIGMQKAEQKLNDLHQANELDDD